MLCVLCSKGSAASHGLNLFLAFPKQPCGECSMLQDRFCIHLQDHNTKQLRMLSKQNLDVKNISSMLLPHLLTSTTSYLQSLFSPKPKWEFCPSYTLSFELPVPAQS